MKSRPCFLRLQISDNVYQKGSIMKRVTLALLAMTMFLSAQVFELKEKIVVDGNLHEAAWKQAEKLANFNRFPIKGVAADSVPIAAQTEFSVLADGDSIYLGIHCHEPKIAQLLKSDASGMWSTDGLEIFIAPSGAAMEYYQFLVTFQNFRYAMFYDEFGVTRPDPHFSPVWESAVQHGKDFWSCEVRIPLVAFSMTRQNLWNSNWLLNIMRRNRQEGEISSWSKLEKSAHESKKFRSIKGFPTRPAKNDFQIRSAQVVIQGRDADKFAGSMKMAVLAPAAAEYEFNAEGHSAGRVSLVAGNNEFSFPCTFSETGKHNLRLSMKRLADGFLFERFYPVEVAYNPLKIRLVSPEYRNNFYPGQNFSHISGRVESSSKDPILLTLSGDGIGKQAITLSETKEFRFETANFPYGKAILRAECGPESVELPIRRLAPKKTMMTWISGGNLIVNGTPTLRRNMYGTYYMGGEAFKKKYDTDNLHETRHITITAGIGRLEPGRLIPGIEAKEATKDVMPCRELFDKVDQVIANLADKDFPYYYLSDEPECRGISPIYLKHIYDYVAEKDPYHVILMASRSAAKLIDCADWIETHPYINPRIDADGKRVYGREISTLGAYLDEISNLNRPDKCIGFLPTIYSAFYQYPNFAEIVCHTWAAMMHGGKTIWPYAYHDMGDRPSLYEGTRYIFSSFERLEEFVLHGKRTRLLRTEDCEAVLYETSKDKMFVLVNFKQEPVKAKIEQLKGRFHEFRGDRTFSSFDFDLEPLECIVATSRKMDQNLPSYKEVSNLIDKLENERCSRKNLLFGKDAECIITTSSPVKSQKKIFDGTLDVVAWQQNHKEKWYEIAFPNDIPVFSQIMVHGKNIGDAVIKIRKRGEWKTLQAAKRETGEYQLFCDFAEKLRTVKLRFEFPQNGVELYEIELFAGEEQ